MSNAFYGLFERRDGGEGLKGQSTHYCPGCGHGLIHKYVAESITELGLQDRTVAISPVGCSVMMYQYMDMGNTQAAQKPNDSSHHQGHSSPPRSGNNRGYTP